MDRSRLEWNPGLWLDARRAVWIEGTRSLVVADLHLGYVWAHRHEGQLLPISVREDSTERLLALMHSYQPREVVFLGDVVHRAVSAPALCAEITRLFAEVSARSRPRIVLGNHDAHLPGLLAECGIVVKMGRQLQAGPHLLLHGDEPDDPEGISETFAAIGGGGRVIIGHEHPAISLSDGVASRVKCPCFLSSSEVLVLPAFSRWAAGTDPRGGRFLSPFARLTQFDRAIAILAGKLLPVRYGHASSNAPYRQ